MRRLLEPRHLTWSLPVGVAIAAANLPALRLFVSPGALAWFGGMLALVCVVMWQAHLAWTPAALLARECWRDRTFGYVVGAVVLLAVVAAFTVDPWMQRRLPEFLPADRYAALVGLPGAMFFKTLFVFVTPYAFVSRLTARPAWARAAVVLTGQLILVLKGYHLDGALLGGLVLVAAVKTWLLSWCYERYGYVGLAVLCGLLYARFLLLPEQPGVMP